MGVRSHSSDKSDWLDKLCHALLRLLSHDFLGLLVLTQSKERRLPEVVVSSPFGEPYLANELRFQPCAPPHFSSREALADWTLLRKIRKWTVGSNQLLEFVIERFEKL